MENIKNKNDIILGLVILFFTFVVGLYSISVLTTAFINVFIISSVFIGFFINDFEYLLLFDLAQMIIMRFSPFFGYEAIFFILLPIVLFFVNKKVLFSNNLIVVILVLFISVFLFWIIFGGVNNMVVNIVLFVYEMIYDILTAGLLFVLILWVKKKFL